MREAAKGVSRKSTFQHPLIVWEWDFQMVEYAKSRFMYINTNTEDDLHLQSCRSLVIV